MKVGLVALDYPRPEQRDEMTSCVHQSASDRIVSINLVRTAAVTPRVVTYRHGG